MYDTWKNINDIPSSMYEGCLNVAIWMSAKRYLAKSLSDTPIRACRRFFVSENFSAYKSERSAFIPQNSRNAVRTGFTTNRKGTP